MSKAYAVLCLVLILCLLAGCGTRIVPAVPTVTPSAPPEEEVPPPPTPTPLLSPPPLTPSPLPRVTPSPTPRVSAAQLPAQRHFPSLLVEDWGDELPAAETVARAETYTVNRGDCLWSIAEELYGSGAEWRRLWAANRETVEDPGLVWVGQVLQLPEENG